MAKTMDKLTIGAVSNLTGIPTHTLRKWESRHHVVTPERSETGRRFYTSNHVERLQHVKQLMAKGHALGELAKLSKEDLAGLAQVHLDSDRKLKNQENVTFVGTHLTAMIEREGEKRFSSATLNRLTFEDWMNRDSQGIAAHGSLVVECSTLPDSVVNDLSTLRRSGYSRVVCIYSFAPRRAERLLASHMVEPLKAPVSSAQIAQQLSLPAVAPNDLDPQPSRFNPKQLAKIANMIPSLHCECPNHIAKLLIDVSGFEQYCKECEDEDPKQRALHVELGRMTAQVRTLLEDALNMVAEADGLDLATFSTSS